MIVKDLLNKVDEERVIARAIYEDRCKPEELNVWITKYYAQLTELKNVNTKKSDFMVGMEVTKDDKHIYGEISGLSYSDIKKGIKFGEPIDYLMPEEYASLYVPEYSFTCYGLETVAAEILREYGWNGFDETILCKDDMRLNVLYALSGMESGLFLTDENYMERCMKQFVSYYEGKPIPKWEGLMPTE